MMSLAQQGWLNVPSGLGDEPLDRLGGEIFQAGRAGSRCLLDHPLVHETAVLVREHLVEQALLETRAVAIQAIAVLKQLTAVRLSIDPCDSIHEFKKSHRIRLPRIFRKFGRPAHARPARGGEGKDRVAVGPRRWIAGREVHPQRQALSDPIERPGPRALRRIPCGQVEDA